MLKFDYITAKGDVMPLLGNANFKLSNIDGMTRANVEVSSSTVATMDGDVINNMRTTPRSIILDLSIEGNDVEEKSRNVLRYVKPKQSATLRLTTREGQQKEISGVVEDIEMPRSTNKVTMQITMYCSQPYWQDVNNVIYEISEIIDLHYFTNYDDDMLYFPEDGIVMGEYDRNRTKVLENFGDVAVGFEIYVIALGDVQNPIIYNANGEYIGANVSMTANDELIISTHKGKKTITLNGDNIFSKLMEGSTWLQLDVGENEYTIDSKDGTQGNMYFTIIYKQRYV